jgi:hypothetical protein
MSDICAHIELKIQADIAVCICIYVLSNTSIYEHAGSLMFEAGAETLQAAELGGGVARFMDAMVFEGVTADGAATFSPLGGVAACCAAPEAFLGGESGFSAGSALGLLDDGGMGVLEE